jgi:esterase/lipase superfamily enzyme
MKYRANCVLLLLLGFGACGCSTYRPFTDQMMLTPSLYYATGIDPYTEKAPISADLTLNIFYATDREPVNENDPQRYYSNRRGHLLRLGEAKVKIQKKGVTWEDLKKYSLLKERTGSFPLQVSDAQEYGPLSLEIPKIMREYNEDAAKAASKEFVAKINERLKETSRKDIYIYVHGYKVEFENPVVIAAELWHYLGYRGVMLAYAWPSTPRTLAYSGDVETAQYSAQNLRYLLEFLAKHTDTERIHIIAYSAGTRLGAAAVRDLALVYSRDDPEALHRELKIENLILIGSDLDRGILRSYARDRMTEVPRYFTVYSSRKDEAMMMSKFIYGHDRVGDFNRLGNVSDDAVEYLKENPNLAFIDVTGAANTKADHGHGYFRQSPWVSSDIFIALLSGRRPEERGLIHGERGGAWKFPEDYLERIQALAEEAKKNKQ